MTEAIEPAGEPMINARQASSALHLPCHWLTDPNIRAKKRIPHYLLYGTVRFRISELEAWWRKHEVATRETGEE